MLIKCTRATVLLGRAQEFFPHSFRPPQVKLHTWPSFIRNLCAPQARRAYSDTKDSLKTGVETVKENIKEGIKKDLIAKRIGAGILTSVGLILFDLSFAYFYNSRNERILLHAFENGFCPEPDVPGEQLIYREDVIKELKRILEPVPDHSSYHIVVGNHGTGKTTVVRQSAKDVRKGVIYIDVPPVLDRFIDKLAQAIGYSFEEYVSFTESSKRKILGNGGPAEKPRISRVLDAFERGARKYKENNGKPPVLILDNISKLGKRNASMLEDLQDVAKLYADQKSCVVVFVSSEVTVPPIMSQQSSWSRADQEPIVIGDLTNKESFTYLHSKLGIEEKVANQLIQLLGGRIRDLKTYGDRINKGETFEEVRKIVFRTINHNFHQALIKKGEKNNAIGKLIIRKLMKNEKTDYDAFVELVNNKEIVDVLIQANVLSCNPISEIITFQSRATEVFMGEHPDL
ncbi:hypothetical protein Glove_103g267 [Diversispora epigaea]|uniref:Orc1-like AAA ATPase domain-containing protein n=1 Tax=Diversispora epigaea TaxID=1348612 RepID=A0A397J3K9_9GLOM|nr:hypothetical protein Glove_103g267 [Diversispora epigaea]